MSNRETMDAIRDAVAAVSQVAHKSLDDQLKLGRPSSEVKDLRDQLNAAVDLALRRIRAATIS